MRVLSRTFIAFWLLIFTVTYARAEDQFFDSKSVKIRYVVEGKGHMKLGGKITDWKRRPVSQGNGKGSAGTTAVGGRDVTIAKGDVLIIPAGTPHKWEDADEFTSYVVVRIDPDRVAPLMALGTAKFVQE